MKVFFISLSKNSEHKAGKILTTFMSLPFSLSGGGCGSGRGDVGGAVVVVGGGVFSLRSTQYNPKVIWINLLNSLRF